MDSFPKNLVAPIVLVAILNLTACSPPQDSKTQGAGAEAYRLELDLLQSMSKIEAAFDWDKYVSNLYLPSASDSITNADATDSLETVTVGLPWLKNDQTPALWLGLARGYFKAEGLDLDIMPGGPGRDNLLRLLSDQIDIAIASSATGIIRMLASETGGEVVAIGALQKAYPYAYIALDETIPRTQESDRIPTKEDFRGKTLGLTPGSELFLDFALNNLGLEKEEVTIRKAGSSLVPLTTGVFDFYSTMADNNPRKLEAMGYKNWMLWNFSEHGWVDYHNVITVRPEKLESKPDTVRAFLRALDRSLRALLADDPAVIADEILPFVSESGLTSPLIAHRLRSQRPITEAKSDEPLLHMNTKRWIEAAAILWRHDAIDLPNNKPSL